MTPPTTARERLEAYALMLETAPCGPGGTVADLRQRAADLRSLLQQGEAPVGWRGALARDRRFRFIKDILDGFSEGIEYDRLEAGLFWAETGKAGHQEAALLNLLAAPHKAALDEGEWSGDPLVAAREDLARVTAEAEALLSTAPQPEAPSLAEQFADVATRNGRGLLAWELRARTLADALRPLVEACERADAAEELSEEVDGSLLDKANGALANFDAPQPEGEGGVGEGDLRITVTMPRSRYLELRECSQSNRRLREALDIALKGLNDAHVAMMRGSGITRADTMAVAEAHAQAGDIARAALSEKP